MNRGAEVPVTASRTAVVPAPRPTPPGEDGTAITSRTAPTGPGRARGGLPASVVARTCRCGHGRDAHEHFRPGSDCATCGCTRYRRRLIAGPC